MKIRERVKKLLRELVSIKSVSGREKEIQEFLESRLSSLGVEVKRQAVEGDRFNLIHEGEGPYLISCHVDTVPPLGMRDAFRPRELGDRIYGRGASDVKGALACLLVALEIFLRGRSFGKLPLSLAFVVDEERNSAMGSEKAASYFRKPLDCLVLEPTYGELCTSQCGALEFTITVEGEGAHGAEFEKTTNPIRVCASLIDSLERDLGRRINVIYMKGGSNHYVVPKKCTALLELKVFEGERWSELEKRVLSVLRKSGEKVTYRREDAEDFIRFRESELSSLMKRLLLEVKGEAREGTMPSWTDAANYHRAGHRCVVFGPGSLKDSHTERESVSVSELEEVTILFLRLFEEMT
ncbi:MAG TPA: M20 family peptidase [Aquifex aeolicus]|nr:M20 family peptidase [Aquifex aeolicus]